MTRKQESALSGQTMAFIAPNHSEIIIREQNGDDEDIISKNKNLLKGDSINFFLSGIIMSIDGNKVSTADIVALRTKVKYHALLKSRIFSLGSELTYKHRCSNKDCSKPQGKEDPTYEEDLSLYDKDFSPTSSDKRKDFKYRVSAYEKDAGLIGNLTTSRGKKLRYKFMTGVQEKVLLEMDKETVSKNTEITLRELEWEQENGEWRIVENFRDFNSKEMSEIRNHISENDMPFEAISECTCPYCGNVDYISLLMEKDFFFPGEI